VLGALEVMQNMDQSKDPSAAGALPKTEEEWRQRLTPQQYHVTRERGTERPFTGEYWDCQAPGVYHCVCCGTPLFASETKFDAGCGWPSFYEALDEQNIRTLPDYDLFTERTEVRCARCGAHLGHVFDDGPAPTGMRYCMNSAALKLSANEPSAQVDR
jgi:peptide-methionine (R)-S-oxide reductase